MGLAIWLLFGSVRVSFEGPVVNCYQVGGECLSLALLHGGVSHLYLFIFKSEVKVNSETVGGTTDPLLLGNFAQ